MIEKTIDFIRIILLLGLVFFVWNQNKTIGQLETRIISLNEHVTDIGRFVEGHEIGHVDNDKLCDGCVRPMSKHEEEVGDIMLELMGKLIDKIDEDTATQD